MDVENEIAKTRQEMRDFLEHVPLAELRRLLNTPLLNAEILAYAAESEVLARRVDEALDAEYDEMPADDRTRLDSVVARFVEQSEPSKAIAITTPSEDWPLGDSSAGDLSGLPSWLHLTYSPGTSPVQLSAQQEEKPGWPVVLSIDVEGDEIPVEIKFDWHLSFLVVEILAASKQQAKVLFRLRAIEREFSLAPGTKTIIGPLEALGLSERSSRNQIVSALLASGIAQPKIDNPS